MLVHSVPVLRQAVMPKVTQEVSGQIGSHVGSQVRFPG